MFCPHQFPPLRGTVHFRTALHSEVIVCEIDNFTCKCFVLTSKHQARTAKQDRLQQRNNEPFSLNGILCGMHWHLGIKKTITYLCRKRSCKCNFDNIVTILQRVVCYSNSVRVLQAMNPKQCAKTGPVQMRVIYI